MNNEQDLEKIERDETILEASNYIIKKNNKRREEAKALLTALGEEKTIASMKIYVEENPPSALVLFFLTKLVLEQNQRDIANKKHDMPGGSRDKQNQMRKLWAIGDYTSRNSCALEEHVRLGLGYETARKALNNTPERPLPKP